jgi:hypothetical protein
MRRGPWRNGASWTPEEAAAELHRRRAELIGALRRRSEGRGVPLAAPEMLLTGSLSGDSAGLGMPDIAVEKPQNLRVVARSSVGGHPRLSALVYGGAGFDRAMRGASRPSGSDYAFKFVLDDYG